MNDLINAKEITSKTTAEVEQEVINLLNRKGYFAGNNGEVESFFSDLDGKIQTDQAQKLEIDGEMIGDWQTTITVVISEHYVDPGSVDYFYTVKVTED